MLPVDAHGQAVAPEKRDALIPRYAQHPVAGVETVVQRLFAGRVAVVDPMSSPVVEEAQGSGSPAVIVAQCERRHAAGNTLPVVQNGLRNGARIPGVEMREVHVGVEIPRLGNPVTQLGVTAVLLEAHVPAMPVGAVVRASHRTRKTSCPNLIRNLGFERIVGPVTGMEVGFHPVLVHPARHDIDDTTHGVRAVQHRSGAAHDLDPVGQHRRAGIGDRMPHQPHVLGMAVDQHQQTRCGTSADTAQRHLPGSPARNAVPHDAASRNEQSRNLLGQRRQQRRLESLGDLLPSDDGNGHRQMPEVGFMPGSGDHDLPDRVGFPVTQAVGGLGPQGAHGDDTAQQQQDKQFRLHLLALCFTWTFVLSSCSASSPFTNSCSKIPRRSEESANPGNAPDRTDGIPFGAFLVLSRINAHYGKHPATDPVTDPAAPARCRRTHAPFRLVRLLHRCAAGLSDGRLHNGIAPRGVALDGGHAGLHVAGGRPAIAQLQGFAARRMDPGAGNLPRSARRLHIPQDMALFDRRDARLGLRAGDALHAGRNLPEQPHRHHHAAHHPARLADDAPRLAGRKLPAALYRIGRRRGSGRCAAVGARTVETMARTAGGCRHIYR